MSEKRKEERKILITFIPVYDLFKNILLGYLRDLTLQGAMVVGSRPAEIDQKLTLAIEFRETPEIPAMRMTIPARVAWCKREQDSTYYDTGVEFLELTDQDRTVIKAVLQRYQFSKNLPA